MLGLDWGDVPTWLAAVGTIGAVVVALGLALREGRRRAEEQRRHQAELVTSWMTGSEVPDPSEPGRLFAGLAVQNASNQLVYQLIASLVITRGAGNVLRQYGVEYRTFLGEVVPGRTDTAIEHGGSGMMMRFGIELAFKDAAGRSWLRTADGKLREISNDPATYYGLAEPVPWQ